MDPARGFRLHFLGMPRVFAGIFGKPRGALFYHMGYSDHIGMYYRGILGVQTFALVAVEHTQNWLARMFQGRRPSNRHPAVCVVSQMKVPCW